jgi:hypothetical protein
MASLTVIGNAFHSVLQNGAALFEQGPFQTGMGNLVIDLAGAPLPDGHYKLEAEVLVAGSVEIYLPRTARYTLSGTTLLGERVVREGLDFGARLRQRWSHFFGKRSRIPELPAGSALVPAQALSFELVVNTLFGGVRLYRL